MINISNNSLIEMNRGDSFYYPLFINKGKNLELERYILSGNDTVYLSIMEPNQPFDFGVVRQIYTKDNLNQNGDLILKIETKDTQNLVPGVYYLEIKIKLNNGNIYTIYPKKKFILF